jgi:nicotinamide mononucleotide transporter
MKRSGVSPIEWLIMASASVILCIFASLEWLGWMEVFGFITGGMCVWLIVRENILNWPIGLLNNIGFFILFYQSRLFADMSLQVVFFTLGVYGWWNWVRNGTDATPLQPTRTTRIEWIAILIFIPIATIVLREILLVAQGAAPFWDAITTVISLAAQYLLSRKRLENWCFWILADLIYVPLYFSRELPLTAVLYGVFLVMCITGLIQWKRVMREPIRT